MNIPKPRAEKEPVNCLMQGVAPKENAEFYQPEPYSKEYFGQIWGTQTHSRRRKMMLEKHPEMAKLLVSDKPYSIILAFILVPLGLTIMYLVKDASWPVFLLSVYIFGGTIAHTLHVLIHDFTHWAGHSSITVCKAMAIFCNIPMGVPSAIPFGKFHSDHHNFLGQYGKDPDLPLMAEVQAIKNRFGKFVFFLAISIIYALRPVLFFRKQIWASELVNALVIICTDYIIWYYMGWNALLYFLFTVFLSIGPHPAAIHVIAQHYQFAKGLETYDYFGPWNFMNLNLGYHTEHHDFPTCPWWNLPKIRAAAPQFYQKLPYHTSYMKVLWKFLFDDNFNLFNRTIRYIKGI